MKRGRETLGQTVRIQPSMLMICGSVQWVLEISRAVITILQTGDAVGAKT